MIQVHIYSNNQVGHLYGAVLTIGYGAVLTVGYGAVLTWGRFDRTPEEETKMAAIQNKIEISKLKKNSTSNL
jgi:hypothetical protein